MGVWGLERRLLKARFSWLGLLNWGGGGGFGFTVGAFIRRIGFWGPLYAFYKKEPPKK